MPSSRAWRRLGLAVVAAVMCGAVGAVPARADGTNLLVNPGFEDSLGNHPWLPAAWDTSRGNTEMVFFGRDGFSAHSGRFGISVANASATIPLWHNWSQTVDVTPDMWGKDIVMTVWTRSNGVDGRAYCFVQAFRDTIGKMSRTWKVPRDEATEMLGYQNANDPIVDVAWKRVAFDDKDTDWVQRTARVYLPPTTNEIILRLGLFGTGQVMFDDCSITLEPAEPAVAPPVRTNMLADPGFEGSTMAWELSTLPFPPIIAEKDSVYAHGGRASMHFNLEAGMASGRAGVAQGLCNRALSGKRLRMGAWVRTDTLRSAVFLQIFCHTATGVTHVTSTSSVYGTMKWTKLQLDADIPEDTYIVWAWVEYSAPVAGHAYFDDASLEVLGPAGQSPPEPPPATPKKTAKATPKPAPKKTASK